MVVPATIQQVVQIGVEVAPGQAVPANKLLQATKIEPSIKVDVSTFRPMGSKFVTVSALGKDWSEARISGRAVYDEIVYLLSGILGYAAPAQQGASAAYKWTFVPAQSTEDAIKTFTVERGSADRAGRFAYGLVNSFGLAIDRNGVEVSGSMLGRAYEDGVSLTADPTAIPAVPIEPTDVDVFIDETAAQIGTTKIDLEAFSANFEISDRFKPVWVLNSELPSFGAHVESEPKASLTLFLAANDIGMSPLAAVRAGEKRWIRIKATGPMADATYNYSFQLDLCGMVTAVGDFSDQEGTFAIEWTLDVAYDSDWGKAMSVEVVNTLTDL